MISTNNRNNNAHITQLHFSKWKANRKMINYYTNPNCKIQFTGLILYIFHATVLCTQVYTQLIAQLVFNPPTCFTCQLQPSSGSYKCCRHVQHAVEVVKYKC
jgi:hypothetical protein